MVDDGDFESPKERNALVAEFPLRQSITNGLLTAAVTPVPATRILITGPTGSGKSLLLNELSTRMEMGRPEVPVINISIANKTGDDICFEAYSQLVDHFLRPEVSERLSMSHGQMVRQIETLAKAALKDLSKHYLPHLQHTATALSELFVGSLAHGNLDGPRPVDDRVAVFKIYLTSVVQVVPVRILFDGLEWAEPSAAMAIRAIDQALTASSESCLVVTHNSDHGPGLLAQLRPYLSQRELIEVGLGPITVNELRDWANHADVHISIEEAQSAVETLHGRPVFLSQWLRGAELDKLGSRLQAKSQSLIESRMLTLPERDQTFLMKLSLFPISSRIDAGAASRLFFEDPSDAITTILRLRAQGFLVQRGTEVGFSNDLIHENISTLIDKRIKHELAIGLLEKSEKLSVQLPEEWIAVLTKDTGNAARLVEHAIPAALSFSHQGRPRLATATYALLDNVAIASEPTVWELFLGKAEALHELGRFGDALTELLVLEKLKPTGNHKALMHRWFASSAKGVGRYRLARDHLKQWQAMISTDQETIELLRIGNTIERDLGDYKEATKSAQKIERLARGNPTLSNYEKNRAYRTLARAYSLAGQHRKALNFGKRALALAKYVSIRELGPTWLAAGEAFRHSGNFLSAIVHYQEAASFGKDCGDADAVIWSLLALADALLLDGKLPASNAALAEIPFWIIPSEHDIPLEVVHYYFSRHVNSILSGQPEAETDEVVLARYRKLDLSWAVNYLDHVRSEKYAPRPKPL